MIISTSLRNVRKLPSEWAQAFQKELPVAVRPDDVTDTRLKPSLLDRITDEDPTSREDPPVSPAQRRRECKASLMRDIEALLNAKDTLGDLPEEFRHSAHSLLRYGLPDFTAMSPSRPGDLTRIVRAVEMALKQFEPRLTRVSVSMETADRLDAGLRLSVVGLVRFGVEPEPIRFETVLKADRREFIVVGDRG